MHQQNTQITMQSTAEEQFAEIAAAAHAEALNDIDDILIDDDSVNFSAPKQQTLEPQVQVQNNIQQVSDSDETNNSTPESATDSSLDTSSIEVIQPHEGLEIRLPINPPQRVPPNSPESPRTNVAVPIPDDLLTEDEETGDRAVPPTVPQTTPADTELYDLEKHAIQIDIDKHKYQNSSYNTDDNSSPCADDNTSQSADGNSSQCADDYIQPIEVSHMQSPTVGEKYHVEHDDNTL